MRHSRVVIIGNGVAGNSAVTAIRRVSKETSITIISKEPFPEYSACVLSKKYISKEMKKEEIFLKTFEDYSKEGIRTIFGENAVEIDVEKKMVLLETGVVNYDKLIIATGSRPIIPPVEGVDKRGIFTLKSLEDAEKIINHCGIFRGKSVVIGPGIIGVEASVALRKVGWHVCLLGGRFGRILRQVYDEKPSGILKRVIEDNDINVITGERIIRFSGDVSIKRVVTDKREIDCDMVILTLGMRPEVNLAQKAGIEIGNLGGIRVNNQMMTNIKDVYACGDCIETRDIITGENILCLQWYSAKQQGEIAGYNSIGIERGYCGAMNIRSVEIFDTYAVSIGHTMDRFENHKLEITEGDNKEYYYRLIVADGIFVGAQFVGKIEDMGPIVSAIRRRDSLDSVRRIINDGALLYRNPWYYRMRPYIMTQNVRGGKEYEKNNIAKSQ